MLSGILSQTIKQLKDDDKHHSSSNAKRAPFSKSQSDFKKKQPLDQRSLTNKVGVKKFKQIKRVEVAEKTEQTDQLPKIKKLRSNSNPNLMADTPEVLGTPSNEINIQDIYNMTNSKIEISKFNLTSEREGSKQFSKNFNSGFCEPARVIERNLLSSYNALTSINKRNKNILSLFKNKIVKEQDDFNKVDFYYIEDLKYKNYKYIKLPFLSDFLLGPKTANAALTSLFNQSESGLDSRRGLKSRKKIVNDPNIIETCIENYKQLQDEKNKREANAVQKNNNFIEGNNLKSRYENLRFSHPEEANNFNGRMANRLGNEDQNTDTYAFKVLSNSIDATGAAHLHDNLHSYSKSLFNDDHRREASREIETQGIEITDQQGVNTDDGYTSKRSQLRTPGLGFMKFSRNFNVKAEFSKMAQISRKILTKIYEDTNKNVLDFEQEKVMELQDVMDPTNIRRFLENTDEFLFVCVLKEYFPVFKNKSNIIVDRILLAFSINPKQDFAIVKLASFTKLVRYAIMKNVTLKEMIEFSIKFFRVDKNNTLEADNFTRILRILTKYLSCSEEDKDSILEKFIINFSNFKIINKEKDCVEFDQMKTVYLSYKLNIFDLVDLIFGYLILKPYAKSAKI